MTIAEKWQQEGWLKGRREGRLEGKREELLKGIELGISIKFDNEQAAVLLPFIRQLHDLNELQAIMEGLKQAHDIAEFMAVLKACVKISRETITRPSIETAQVL